MTAAQSQLRQIFERPYLKKYTSQKRAGGVAQSVSLEFKCSNSSTTKNR
jgi:hypothetical protein